MPDLRTIRSTRHATMFYGLEKALPLAFVLLFLNADLVLGQEFERILVPGGGNVTAISQDHQGYMWFGTSQGLFRYDGYNFEAFQHSPGDATSLSSDYIEDVFVDRTGTLWVGTFGGGLGRFDSKTHEFENYRRDETDPFSLSGDTVSVIVEDRSGDLWIGTNGGGISRLEKATGRFVRFRHDPRDAGTLPGDVIRTIYEDRAGTIWVGTEPSAGEGLLAGLSRFDPASDRFTRVQRLHENPQILERGNVRAILEDRQRRFWIGTAGGGVHLMNRSDRTVSRFDFAPTSDRWLTQPVRGGSATSPVNFIHEDASGMLWFGILGGGLSRLDPTTNVTVNYVPETGRPNGLADRWLWSVYESRDGVLWFGTLGYSGAVYKLDPIKTGVSLKSLHHGGLRTQNSVSAFSKNRNGTVWMATSGGGLFQYDRKSRSLLPSAGRQGVAVDLSHYDIRVLHEDADGILWIGTIAGGLFRYDQETRQLEGYRGRSTDPTKTCESDVFAIHEDRAGNLWIGTWWAGLCLFDRASNSLSRFISDRGEPMNGIIHVTAIHEDRSGDLWIGTWGGGLHRLDRETGFFTRFQPEPENTRSLSSRFVSSIVEDDLGKVWIGTSSGLSLLETDEKGHVLFLRDQSELKNRSIKSMLSDGEGGLWISADGGLSRYSPDTGLITSYGVLDGLDPRLLTGGIMRAEDGELYVGATNGFFSFRAEDIRKNPHPPQILIASLAIIGEDGEASRIPVLESGSISLDHDQQDLVFHFVSFHYSNPKENRYRYILEGYDETWREAGFERTASYSKLPPGTYRFRVKAASADGIWTEEGGVMNFRIHPPWWQTPWAYMLYVFLVAGALFSADHIQRRRLLLSERHRSALREAELRAEVEREHRASLERVSEMKSRFFANISHEFRTPLTLILGPLSDATKRNSSLDQDQMRLMHVQAERLLNLINQLLDLSKLESGAMSLVRRRGDVAAFMRALTGSFASRAQMQAVSLSFNSHPPQIIASYDAEKIQKTLTNLLSNAFKFTPSGGKISVTVRAEGGEVVVTVRDTGPGIPANELERIFDRFYQVDASLTRRYDGSGIGLALAKELVELHGGSISVESEFGFGSSFTLRLPLLDDTGDLPEGAPATPESFPVPSDENAPQFEKLTPAETPELEEALEAEQSRKRILIVEDHPDLRGYLRRVLDSAFTVSEAADGVEGLRMARELKPDLIIADLMMPLMDGLALTRAVRGDATINHTPVIILTAKADAESRIEGLEEGADDYLPKPFNSSELLVRVENLIEIRRLLRRKFSGETLLGPSRIAVTSQDTAFIERIRQVVEQRMEHSDFGVEQLADEVALSTRQLQRRVKEVTQLSAAGYIRMMRLKRAAQLIEQDAGGISEIAYRVGYRDAEHFSKLFKQVYGVAPSEFSGDRQ